MKCPRCLNEDRRYFYKGSKGWYCRKCIGFGRALIQEEREAKKLQEIEVGSEEYTLQYPLTEKQKEIGINASQMIFHTDILIQAVCGAGKTEMVVPVIARCLKEKKKICFAIARRQVVLELQGRLRQYFPYAKVIAVCGGHTQVLDGDLIICTTHQLYRYEKAFDVLILDEPDAFPFKGDEVLHGIARSACKGHCLYLTATPDEEIMKHVNEGEMIRYRLNRRPHGHDLPVPKLIVAPVVLCIIFLFQWINKYQSTPRMIFVPTIKEAHILHVLINIFHQCFMVTSKSEYRDEIIQNYRQKEDGVIVATTVLERGVTVPRANICVFHADSHVFDQAGLVQMAGRAGRSFQYPDGDVLFLSFTKSAIVEQSRSDILEANQCNV